MINRKGQTSSKPDISGESLEVDALESLCDEEAVFPGLLASLRSHVACRGDVLVVAELVGVLLQDRLEGLAHHIDGCSKKSDFKKK